MPCKQHEAVEAVQQAQREASTSLSPGNTIGSELPLPLASEAVRQTNEGVRAHAKKLSASDTAMHGSLSVPRKAAETCLPTLVREKEVLGRFFLPSRAGEQRLVECMSDRDVWTDRQTGWVAGWLGH